MHRIYWFDYEAMISTNLKHATTDEKSSICTLSLLFQVRAQARHVIQLLSAAARSDSYDQNNAESFRRIVSIVTAIHDALNRISTDSKLLGKLIMAEQRQGVLSLIDKGAPSNISEKNQIASGTDTVTPFGGTSDHSFPSNSTRSRMLAWKSPNDKHRFIDQRVTRNQSDAQSTEDDTPLSWMNGKSRYRKPLLASSSARCLLRVRSYQNIRQVFSGCDQGAITPSSAISGKSGFAKNPLLKKIAASYPETQSLIGLSITPVQDQPSGENGKETNTKADMKPYSQLNKPRSGSVLREGGPSTMSKDTLEKNGNQGRDVSVDMNPCISDKMDQASVQRCRILDCLRNNQMTSSTAYLPLWWKTSCPVQYSRNDRPRRKSLSVDTIDTRRGGSIIYSLEPWSVLPDVSISGDVNTSIFSNLDNVIESNHVKHSPLETREVRNVSSVQQTFDMNEFTSNTPTSLQSYPPLSNALTESRWGESSIDLWSNMSVATSELHCQSLSTTYKQLPSQFYSTNFETVLKIREVLLSSNYTLEHMKKIIQQYLHSSRQETRAERQNENDVANIGVLDALSISLRNLFPEYSEVDVYSRGTRLYLMALIPFFWLLSGALVVIGKTFRVLESWDQQGPLLGSVELSNYVKKLTMCHEELSMFILREQSVSDFDEGYFLEIPAIETTKAPHKQNLETMAWKDSGEDSHMRKSDATKGDDVSEGHLWTARDRANDQSFTKRATIYPDKRLLASEANLDEDLIPVRSGERVHFRDDNEHDVQTAGISSTS